MPTCAQSLHRVLGLTASKGTDSTAFAQDRVLEEDKRKASMASSLEVAYQ